MTDWKEIYFNDFIKLNRGFDLPNEKIQEGDYPVVASTTIKAYHNEFKVNGEGVITGRSGSLGSVQYVNGKYWPLNTALYVKDFKGNIPKFVYFFLKEMHLENFDSGAGVPTLNQNHLHKLKIKVPNVETQQKIANILSSYDELIEVNNQRIKTLEETAQALYKEWFVRFRFPDYQNTKFIKGIPKGWEVVKLVLVLDIKTGKLNSNAAVNDGEYPFFTCSNTDFKTNTFSFDTEAVLLAGNNAAGVYPLKYFKGKFDAYQRTYIIKPKTDLISHKYVYYFFLERLEYLQSISIGAATQFLTTQMLNKLPITVPNEEVMKKFSKLVDPVFEQIQTLKLQNTELRQIRDRLLPRLISGKITV